MNIEPDSDLDFNPGAYVPEDILAQRHISSKRRKRRLEVVPPKRPVKRRSMKAKMILVCQLSIFKSFLEVHINNPEVPNQLLRYFGA